jgi:hypothetical protein
MDNLTVRGSMRNDRMIDKSLFAPCIIPVEIGGPHATTPLGLVVAVVTN